MSKHRSRIERLDPDKTGLRLLRWTTPPGAVALGYIRCGDDEGRLLRLSSGSLILQLPGGAFSAIDQRKAAALLQND